MAISLIIYRDFIVSLDLQAKERDNCAINNHTIVCIIYYAYNWEDCKINHIIEDCKKNLPKYESK